VTEFDRRVHELSGREKIDYTVEHKFDGLSIALLYENGALVRGCYARRWNDRRRCDAECADDPVDSFER